MKLEEIVMHLYYIQGCLKGIASVAYDCDTSDAIGDVEMKVSELIAMIQNGMKEGRQ